VLFFLEHPLSLTYRAHGRIEAWVDILTGVGCLFWTSIFSSWASK
jgi:hypothetical protein